MERRTDLDIQGWNVAGLSPHVLSASLTSDLLLPCNWTISKSITFREAFGIKSFNDFGIPFMPTGSKSPIHTQVNGRIVKSSPMGWLEGNVIEILDPNHIWYDPHGLTLYLFLRLNTAGVGYAAVLKIVEKIDDGSHQLFTEFPVVPSGERIVFMPFPGGQNKFFIIFDSITSLYWLASSQVTDSMTRIDVVDKERFNLPGNQRNRLALYFSNNCFDWVFAGMISIGEKEKCARNYPSIVVDGNDLLIVSRAGDVHAKDCQYTNLIMLHRVSNFRSLVY